MRRVRATLLRALVLGVLTLAGATAAAPAAAAGPSVSAALSGLERANAITPAQYTQYYNAYVAAKRSLAKLSGTRRAELGAVMGNVQAMAAGGYFIASRLPVIFLTLENNRRWWTTEPLPSSGTRVSFPGSKLVWEYYAGQGIEIQWLGTFGEGNGYFLSGHENANLRQLLAEVLPLATKRAGGIAWEYMFQFDGGRPPWTSGLSQGTALQVLARSWSRFKEPALLTAAQQAVGIFQNAPSGRRAGQDAGGLGVRRVHLRAQRPHPQRLHPGRRRPVRLHADHQRPTRAQAVRSGRRRGARGDAALRHGRLVACTTSSPNPTSTTTNCSPNSCSICANARAKAHPCR